MGSAEERYVHKAKVATDEKGRPTSHDAQQLVDGRSGPGQCSLKYITNPPGTGSTHGLHTHDTDQVFYVLEGTMFVEIEGETFTVEPGAAVVFPAGVPHRNWNEEGTVHLSYQPVIS